MPDPARQPSPPANPFAVDPDRMFDLTETQALHELFATPRNGRSNAWAAAFFPALWNASLELPQNPVFHGPDLFPYVRLHLPTPAELFQSNCVSNLARQAVERAHGIAIFASLTATEPEFVLSMGLVDSLLTYGSWLGDRLTSPTSPARRSSLHRPAVFRPSTPAVRRSWSARPRRRFCRLTPPAPSIATSRKAGSSPTHASLCSSAPP